jgi:hypothetical protein
MALVRAFVFRDDAIGMEMKARSTANALEGFQQ